MKNITISMNLTTSKIMGIILILSSILLIIFKQFQTAFGFASLGSGLIGVKTITTGMNKRSEINNNENQQI